MIDAAILIAVLYAVYRLHMVSMDTSNREVLLKIASLLEQRQEADKPAYSYTVNTDPDEEPEEPGVYGLTDEELLDWQQAQLEKARRREGGLQ